MKFYAMSNDTTRIPIRDPFSSLFTAINIATRDKDNRSCVREGSVAGNIVWQKSDTPKYYCYQSQQYKGFVVADAEAKEWAKNNENSHVITGHKHTEGPPLTIEPITYGAYPIYENAKHIKGDASFLELGLERNRGAYFYNFTDFSFDHNKVSAIFDLSDATFKLMNSQAVARPFNIYMFVGIRGYSSHTYEAGLTLSSEILPFQLNPYIKPAGADKYVKVNPLALSSYDGIYSYGDSIRITLEVAEDGVLRAEFYDYKTRTSSGNIKVKDDTVVFDQSHCCFFGISLVSYNEAYGDLFDCRSGCYAKNIKIKESFIYDKLAPQEGISFAPNTSFSKCSHLYNTDCSSYASIGSSTETVETVNIFYDGSSKDKVC